MIEKKKIFFTITLPNLVNDIQNKTFHKIIDNSVNLQGEGVKFIIPANIIDLYTTLEVLIGLKLSGDTNTLTEASNIIDELYKRKQTQDKPQYQNALDNMSTQQMELPSKVLEPIAFITRPKIEQHLLIVMNKTTHEEHLSIPLRSNKKQFKIGNIF